MTDSCFTIQFQRRNCFSGLTFIHFWLCFVALFLDSITTISIMHKLYIGNLGDCVTAEDLEKTFDEHKIPYSGQFLMKNGYAFVDCPDDHWAMKAIETFSGELRWTTRPYDPPLVAVNVIDSIFGSRIRRCASPAACCTLSGVSQFYCRHTPPRLLQKHAR